jgi:hypothetical protein
MRECGDCTMCCQGHIYTEVNGEQIHPGNPCKHLSSHCTIYKNRPDNPCKQFLCQWLINEDFPLWLKPSQSNVMAWLSKDPNGNTYLDVSECGKPMPSNILAWFYNYHQQTKLPMRIQIHNHFYLYNVDSLNLKNYTLKSKQAHIF